MKNTINTLIRRTFFFSVRDFCEQKTGSIKSMVRTELEVRTRLESVLIEAERTRITTIPMRTGESCSSIVGITASYPPSGLTPSALILPKSLPKPPRK